MATKLYSTLLHTLHSNICILHYTLYNLHSALCTLHSALFISGCQGTILLCPTAIEETTVFIDQGTTKNKEDRTNNLCYVWRKKNRRTKNYTWHYQDDLPYYNMCWNSGYRYSSLTLGTAFSNLLEKQDIYIDVTQVHGCKHGILNLLCIQLPCFKILSVHI